MRSYINQHYGLICSSLPGAISFILLESLFWYGGLNIFTRGPNQAVCAVVSIFLGVSVGAWEYRKYR